MHNIDALIIECSKCFLFKLFVHERDIAFQSKPTDYISTILRTTLYRDYIAQSIMSLDYYRKLYNFSCNLQYDKETKLFRRISV